MPITITPTSQGGYVGPGSWIDLRSDVLGPPGPCETWTITFTPLGTTEGTWYSVHFPVDAQRITIYQLRVQDQHLAQSSDFVTPQNGQQIRVSASITSDTGLVDQGEIQVPYDAVSALGDQALALPSTTDTGLTPQESQQLTETHQSTFLSESLDRLTLSELTNGPQGGVIAAQLPSVVFGVIVRIANVPDELTASTPDEDYWVPSLCVVRVFRGADLWLRVPVHTSSKIIPFASQDLVVAVAELTLTDWLLNLSIQAFFREGVTGQVFLMRFP